MPVPSAAIARAGHMRDGQRDGISRDVELRAEIPWWQSQAQGGVGGVPWAHCVIQLRCPQMARTWGKREWRDLEDPGKEPKRAQDGLNRLTAAGIYLSLHHDPGLVVWAKPLLRSLAPHSEARGNGNAEARLGSSGAAVVWTLEVWWAQASGREREAREAERVKG